uniref:Si:dkey-83h2.3 n=1 Tax=Scleropages formosus TaxID=113540 RepID=A0A8C9RZZ5_SCLFO
MCVARCSRFVGVSLVPLAVLCILGNILLLLPDLQTRYLLEGHLHEGLLWLQDGGELLPREVLPLCDVLALCVCVCVCNLSVCLSHAQMLWLVGYSCIAMVAAGICFVTSSTGLVNGPLCLHNSTEGPVVEKRDVHQPRGVVLWNVVLFSILMAASAIQVLLCIVHTLNAILGMLCGNSFGRNKVRDTPGKGRQSIARHPKRDLNPRPTGKQDRGPTHCATAPPHPPLYGNMK